ncbi:uncharacterized protein EV420DRAFT_1482113 [Desarmillaria tabescens]|uniref:Uncharacterized protein n=1 Tax=Armillaria tabescens TaxID=1929756 RepID=A0AA39K1K8_ARMTA|nr:uncharacterized protein EV420DRAFT_1482113 [Desarmillaria tabescens]KAK0452819.1 hypothetical protein EV420DRAFT_1482113 [Desarmillaria tabescens]
MVSRRKAVYVGHLEEPCQALREYQEDRELVWIEGEVGVSRDGSRVHVGPYGMDEEVELDGGIYCNVLMVAMLNYFEGGKYEYIYENIQRKAHLNQAPPSLSYHVGVQVANSSWNILDVKFHRGVIVNGSMVLPIRERTQNRYLPPDDIKPLVMAFLKKLQSAGMDVQGGEESWFAYKGDDEESERVKKQDEALLIWNAIDITLNIGTLLGQYMNCPML